MKRNTPLITLLTGAALGVVLLIASMLATPSKAPTSYSAPATPAPPSTAAQLSPESPTPTATSPASAVVTAPARADYAGEVQGGGASVAISIHDGQAIAYVCNGSVIEAWYKGTAVGGVLIMTGKNHAHLSAIYDFSKATGDILAHGTDYRFSVSVVHKPSGLYQAIAVVRGATIKAGWIVLANGTQVGSMEPNELAANPTSQAAPKLDVSSLTAQYEGTTIAATPIDGETGSGF